MCEILNLLLEREKTIDASEALSFLLVKAFWGEKERLEAQIPPLSRAHPTAASEGRAAGCASVPKEHPPSAFISVLARAVACTLSIA